MVALSCRWAAGRAVLQRLAAMQASRDKGQRETEKTPAEQAQSCPAPAHRRAVPPLCPPCPPCPPTPAHRPASPPSHPAITSPLPLSLSHFTPAITSPQEAVLKRCLAAEPRYGERWQRVAKDPAFAHQKPEAVLKRVAADLDKPL